MTRPLIGLLCGLAIACTLGCGSKEAPTEANSLPGTQDSLDDLKSLLTFLKDSGQKPPQNSRAMHGFEASNPACVTGVLRQEIIYFYGSGLTGGDKVIAHDAKADANGGWVLLQDGTLKELTAEEFKSAPKAATARR